MIVIVIIVVVVVVVAIVIVTDRALPEILAAAGRSDAARLLPHGTLRYVTQKYLNIKNNERTIYVNRQRNKHIQRNQQSSTIPSKQDDASAYA